MERFLNLEFRGEGNCAIVFANLQTNHVYRLVKYNATRKLRKLLQNGINSETNKDVQNIQSAVKSELDSVVSYVTNIMRPLLTERYLVTPATTSIPVGFGENAVALAGQDRPAHRKNSQFDAVDSDILYALVLPDCCFVHHSETCHLKHNTSTDSTDADDSFEGPSPTDSGESQKINRNNSSCSSCSQESTSDFHDESMYINISPCVDDGEDRESKTYRSNDDVTNADEVEDSVPHIYGSSDRSSQRNISGDHSIYISDNSYHNQGRHTVYNSKQETIKDASFTISIEIKPKKAFMNKVKTDSSEVGQVCRFCMHQHLKRKSGMWPQTSSYCPLDLFSGNKQRMKHALFSLIKTPQNNLKICRDGREVYGSDIRMDLNSILRNWFPDNPSRRQRLINVFLDLVTEILLNVSGTISADETVINKLQPQHVGVQKCDSSSFVHCKDDTPQGLPQGCVLERIYSLQSLDDLDIEGVFPLYTRLKTRLEQEPHLWNKWSLNGPYDDVTWLFGAKGEQLDDLDSDSDDYAALKVKRFLVSKTLQDCSIIVAIKPVVRSTVHNKRDLIRFEGDLYEFSIKVIDLDPKPFEKVKTYYGQASDIARTFVEAASKSSNSSSR